MRVVIIIVFISGLFHKAVPASVGLDFAIHLPYRSVRKELLNMSKLHFLSHRQSIVRYLLKYRPLVLA